MPVKRIDVTTVDARVLALQNAPLNIHTNLNIGMVSEVNNKEAKVEFAVTMSYQTPAQTIGVIKLEAVLFYEGDAPALAKKWSAERQMPDDVAQEIHDSIWKRLIPDAVLVARVVGLHPPVPLPQYRPGKQQPRPSSGIEVA